MTKRRPASVSAAALSSIEYSPLGENTRRDQFACGDADIDKWFRKKAFEHHCANRHIVTCASFQDDEGQMVGFYALSSVIEEAKKLPEVSFFPFGGTKQFPCVQLVYLAVQREFQRQPEKYGSTIMGEVIRTFADVGLLVGLPALILIPLNKGVASFYQTLGFEPYDSGTRMFLPLQSAVAAVEEAEAEA